MSDKKAEYDGSIDRHLLKLIDFRNEAIKLMFEVKDHKESGIYIEDISGNNKSLKKLKTVLNWLLMNYWVKNKYTGQDKEYIDDDIKEKVEKETAVPSADNLDFNECQKLLYGIIEMMEDLGHTKYESDKTGRTTV